MVNAVLPQMSQKVTNLQTSVRVTAILFVRRRKGYGHLLLPNRCPSGAAVDGKSIQMQISRIVPLERELHLTGSWIFFISRTNLLHLMLIVVVEVGLIAMIL